MNTNIFKSKRNELVGVLREALAKGLPPLFRVHRALLEKAEPSNFELECPLRKFAQSLGYNVYELESILKDLSILGFIEYQFKGKNKCRIEVLIH